MENKEIEAALIASGISDDLKFIAQEMIESGRLVIMGWDEWKITQ